MAWWHLDNHRFTFPPPPPLSEMNKVKLPDPPAPLKRPDRLYRATFFRGKLVETKESKRIQEDYEMFMEGYWYALGAGLASLQKRREWL